MEAAEMNNSKIFITAAQAFERQFDCRLCLHDYIGYFKGCTLPIEHLNPFCTDLKKRNPRLSRTCMAFDRDAVQQLLGQTRKAFYKYCHCGFLEAVIPINIDDKVCGVLFAGPFAGKSATGEELLSVCRLKEYQNYSGPPPLDRSKRDDLLALGTLLAAQLAVDAVKPAYPGGDRRDLTEQFLKLNFSKPVGLGDLAEFIGLSSPRTSELVKKIFGQGFSVLLTQKRLQTAKMLLEHSSFNIETVAKRCGFNDSAYFHRVFRRHNGETPAQFRLRSSNHQA